jgi:hypothetical protein
LSDLALYGTVTGVSTFGMFEVSHLVSRLENVPLTVRQLSAIDDRKVGISMIVLVYELTNTNTLESFVKFRDDILNPLDVGGIERHVERTLSGVPIEDGLT